MIHRAVCRAHWHWHLESSSLASECHWAGEPYNNLQAQHNASHYVKRHSQQIRGPTFHYSAAALRALAPQTAAMACRCQISSMDAHSRRPLNSVAIADSRLSSHALRQQRQLCFRRPSWHQARLRGEDPKCGKQRQFHSFHVHRRSCRHAWTGVRRAAGPGNGSERDNSAYPPSSGSAGEGSSGAGSAIQESDAAFLLKLLFMSVSGEILPGQVSALSHACTLRGNVAACRVCCREVWESADGHALPARPEPCPGHHCSPMHRVCRVSCISQQEQY